MDKGNKRSKRMTTSCNHEWQITPQQRTIEIRLWQYGDIIFELLDVPPGEAMLVAKQLEIVATKAIEWQAAQVAPSQWCKMTKTNKDLVHALADLFNRIELDPDEIDEIDEILREAGYDPDEIGERAKKSAIDASHLAVKTECLAYYEDAYKILEDAVEGK